LHVREKDIARFYDSVKGSENLPNCRWEKAYNLADGLGSSKGE